MGVIKVVAMTVVKMTTMLVVMEIIFVRYCWFFNITGTSFCDIICIWNGCLFVKEIFRKLLWCMECWIFRKAAAENEKKCREFRHPESNWTCPSLFFCCHKLNFRIKFLWDTSNLFNHVEFIYWHLPDIPLTLFWCSVSQLNANWEIDARQITWICRKYEPHHEKTCLRGFRTGTTETSLFSYRD